MIKCIYKKSLFCSLQKLNYFMEVYMDTLYVYLTICGKVLFESKFLLKNETWI